MGEKVILFFVLTLLCFGYVNAQSNSITTDSLFSTSLKENRKIKIVLPSDYSEKNNKLYDVLYVLDGEWYTELAPNAYNFAKSSGFVPNTIIVLIPNVYTNGINQRNRDFEPSSKNDTNGTKLFLSFLKDELLPYIDNKYPNSGQKSLLGSSLGGLFTVYTFLTDPDLFQAYLACDPNLDWGNNYLAKLALVKLPAFEKKKCILFIAANDYSLETNGGEIFQKSLKEKAPKSIHWQVKTYQQETHYSIQYKAFYDGLKYSHLGFWPEKFDFAPKGAFIKEGKPLRLFVLNKNPAVSYTIDGTYPTEKSPRFAPDQSIVINKPTTLNIKTIANRDQYEDSVKAIFRTLDGNFGIKTEQGRDTSTTYSSFDGTWPEFPSVELTGANTESPKKLINKKTDKDTNTILVIKKTFKVDADCYYVFVIDAPNGSRLYLGDKLLIDSTKKTDSRMQSFGAYLKRGYYKTTVQLLQIKNGKKPSMRMFKTTTSNANWWENEL